MVVHRLIGALFDRFIASYNKPPLQRLCDMLSRTLETCTEADSRFSSAVIVAARQAVVLRVSEATRVLLLDYHRSFLRDPDLLPMVVQLHCAVDPSGTDVLSLLPLLTAVQSYGG